MNDSLQHTFRGAGSWCLLIICVNLCSSELPAEEAPRAAVVVNDPHPVPERNRTVDLLKQVLKTAEQDQQRMGQQQTLIIALTTGEFTIRIGDQVFHFVYVPPGNAALGLAEEARRTLLSLTSNALVGTNSTPAINGRFVEGFFILDQEVTEKQYALFNRPQAATSPQRRVEFITDDDEARRATTAAADRPYRPATGITWDKAVDFCDWYSRQTGLKVRLPTEIEWEYAARGPTGGLLPWTDSPKLSKTSFDWRSMSNVLVETNLQLKDLTAKGPRGVTRDVSWCGARDLAGGVAEWCQNPWTQRLYDRLAADFVYRPSAPPPFATAQPSEQIRVIRGGSFHDSADHALLTTRRFEEGTTRTDFVGLRPVIIIDVKTIGASQ